MSQKLQELASKLYEEGIQKGETKSQEIIAEAQNQAQAILRDAKTSAENIVRQAQQQAAELKRNTASEIELSSRQSLSALKNKIVNLITAKVIDKHVADVMRTPENMRAFIQSVIDHWPKQRASRSEFELFLPENQQRDLENYLACGAQKILAEGLEIYFSKNFQGGFQIGIKDEGYKISLTEEDFMEFFKHYLRPKTKKLLFGE